MPSTLDKTVSSFSVTLPAEDVHRGPLILVNRDHPLSGGQGGAPSLASLTLMGGASAPILLAPMAEFMLRQLLLACDGQRDIVPVSGYRSAREQQLIYDQSMMENGREFTQKYVARVQQSEHQTGLAIDLGENRPEVDFICPAFPDSGACRRFAALAAQFGFIRRYPKEKESLTGIAFEPWHFRYVGFPHAAIMEEYGLCLEEYIQWLKNFCLNDPLYFGGYAVYFCPAQGPQTRIPILSGSDYLLSGNNWDGFVVAVR